MKTGDPMDFAVDSIVREIRGLRNDLRRIHLLDSVEGEAITHSGLTTCTASLSYGKNQTYVCRGVRNHAGMHDWYEVVPAEPPPGGFPV